jgi:hypothetical protein
MLPARGTCRERLGGSFPGVPLEDHGCQLHVDLLVNRLFFSLRPQRLCEKFLGWKNDFSQRRRGRRENQNIGVSRDFVRQGAAVIAKCEARKPVRSRWIRANSSSCEEFL